MQHLDQQLAVFDADLRRLVGLTVDEARKVATLVAADVRFLPKDVKAEIEAASPVPLSARRDELIAFQSWNDFARSIKANPSITRAQVIVQNYVCFSYLKDACFEVVARKAAEGSVAARCSRFLTSGSVRDFRNAFSHANWCYKPDFTGLKCWVLEDARRRDGQLKEFAVSQQELDFWQALARGVAYATYEQLCG
jgi:hypothetical protein